VYFNWRQFQKAEVEARSALEQSAAGNRTKAHWALGIALQAQGRIAEAEAEMRRALALDPKDSRTTVALALLLVQTQRPSEAEQLWQRGEENWKAWGGLGHTSRAYYRVAKGEYAAATDELWKGYEAREGSFPYFLVDPRFDNARGEKRFVELVNRVTGDN
jgi:tetratricopeptide (TPR) repeat protein